MRKVASNLHRSERGATAIVIAITMLLLMGFAAIALDGGAGFSEKRQAQSGVDFASLAALQAATSCPSPCTTTAAANAGAAEAMTVTAANLPGRSLDWVACSDPGRPAEFTVVATSTPCVSFTENFDKSRVYLPDDALPTTFGRLLGAGSLTIKAFAEAGQNVVLSADVIPHTPTGASGSELCLFSNQAPQTIPPCDGAASGFYGYLDMALYGSDEVGTPSTCANGTTNKRIGINLTRGGDHSVIVWDNSPPDPVVNDHAACPNTSEDVNELRVETGSPTGGVTDGLINGVSGSINGQPFTAAPGRIVCDLYNAITNPNGYSTQCRSVRGHNLDDTPLSAFLTPAACGGTTPTTHAAMKSCIEAGNASFTSAVADHPRFAAVPILWPKPPQTQAPTGPGNYRIKDFLAVWIESLFLSCNANDCETIHSTGDATGPSVCPSPIDPAVLNCGWSDTSGPDDVEGMVAFNLPLSSLPADITDTFPGQKTKRDFALTR